MFRIIRMSPIQHSSCFDRVLFKYRTARGSWGGEQEIGVIRIMLGSQDEEGLHKEMLFTSLGYLVQLFNKIDKKNNLHRKIVWRIEKIFWMGKWHLDGIDLEMSSFSFIFRLHLWRTLLSTHTFDSDFVKGIMITNQTAYFSAYLPIFIAMTPGWCPRPRCQGIPNQPPLFTTKWRWWLMKRPLDQSVENFFWQLDEFLQALCHPDHVSVASSVI